MAASSRPRSLVPLNERFRGSSHKMTNRQSQYSLLSAAQRRPARRYNCSLVTPLENVA
jgi:hypothetical protein